MDIHYICPMLQVFDMEVSLKFYVDVLGFSVNESAGDADDMGWVWLTRNGTNLMLNTQFERPDRPDKADVYRVAAHHDTILYLGCPDVDRAYEELLGKGLKISPPTIAPYGMKQLYISDPDGYGLCFQWKT